MGEVNLLPPPRHTTAITATHHHSLPQVVADALNKDGLPEAGAWSTEKKKMVMAMMMMLLATTTTTKGCHQ
jgi:hypothetical protein